jgi:hypothetical protein
MIRVIPAILIALVVGVNVVATLAHYLAMMPRF